MPGGRDFANASTAASGLQSSVWMRKAAMRKPVRLKPCVQCTAITSSGFCCTCRLHSKMNEFTCWFGKFHYMFSFGNCLCICLKFVNDNMYYT